LIEPDLGEVLRPSLDRHIERVELDGLDQQKEVEVADVARAQLQRSVGNRVGVDSPGAHAVHSRFSR
jgi:hypothetical protein